MANLYEKFEKVDEAERTYRQVAESNPNDPKACGALAAFYNKPLWKDDQGTPRSKFDQAIEILERCANLDPERRRGLPEGGHLLLGQGLPGPPAERPAEGAYADKGLEAVDKALKIKPDYFDAVIYKGLLIRVKANATTDQRQRQQYLDQAQLIQKQALELKKQQQQARKRRRGPWPPRPAAPRSSPARRAPRRVHGSPSAGCVRVRPARKALRRVVPPLSLRATPPTRRPGPLRGTGRRPGAARAGCRASGDGGRRGLARHRLGDDPDALHAGALGDVHGLHHLAVGDLPRRPSRTSSCRPGSGRCPSAGCPARPWSPPGSC